MLLLGLLLGCCWDAEGILPDARPPLQLRNFSSVAIDEVVSAFSSEMKDKDLATLFSNCFPNTLDTTVRHTSEVKGIFDTFVVTGDIPAMWLRDSANQAMPPFSHFDT